MVSSKWFTDSEQSFIRINYKKSPRLPRRLLSFIHFCNFSLAWIRLVGQVNKLLLLAFPLQRKPQTRDYTKHSRVKGQTPFPLLRHTYARLNWKHAHAVKQKKRDAIEADISHFSKTMVLPSYRRIPHTTFQLHSSKYSDRGA